MKALSIRQPYAWAIVAGLKPVENRTWYSSYRGPLAIHAGVSWYDGKKYGQEDIVSWGGALGDAHAGLGGVVGIVDMIDCVSKHDSSWFFGPYGFVLANPRPCKFVPMKGQLGFFDIHNDLIKVA